MKTKWKKYFMIGLLTSSLLLTGIKAGATENTSDNDGALDNKNAVTSEVSDSQGEDSSVQSGSDSDIFLNGCSISGNQAGESITVKFTVNTGSDNPKYSNAGIKSITPVVNADFPFSSSDEAYKVTSGNGAKSVQCSYEFKAKDDLKTGYYPVDFNVAYTRQGTGKWKDAYSDIVYNVNKSINVKIIGKKQKKDSTATEDDIRLTGVSAPDAVYGGGCTVKFTAVAKNSRILAISPELSDTFPFSSGAAYKTYKSAGTQKMTCTYPFRVKKDITTGYHSVVFSITYKKGTTVLTTKKTIMVYAKGKKNEEKTEKISTPRLMATGCTLDKQKIYANDMFTARIVLHNYAGKTVSNIKVAISSENGEFVPVSGSGNLFIQSMASGEEKIISLKMRVASGVVEKSYPIKVKTDYEDSKANPFSEEDNLLIPVSEKSHVTLTDITAPEMLCVGGSDDLCFTINNLGSSQITDVSAKCIGDDFSCEKAEIGNVNAGAAGYATITLNAEKVTEGDGRCKIIVSYINAGGKRQVIKASTNVIISDEEDMDTDVDMGEDVDAEQKGGMQSKLPIVIAGIVVAVIAAVIIHKRRKHKKLAKELMEDDI